MASHMTNLEIRQYIAADAAQVRDLFVRVNRELAPARLRDAFQAYIARSLTEEIDRIADYYYRERDGGFWVAVDAEQVAGMFGLEPAGSRAMELRRMYVDPDRRRLGLARRMLAFAEDECRRRGLTRLELSTSELQAEALALYRNAGFVLQREAIAQAATNKTLGSGLRRFHFAKDLQGMP